MQSLMGSGAPPPRRPDPLAKAVRNLVFFRSRPQVWQDVYSRALVWEETDRAMRERFSACSKAELPEVFGHFRKALGSQASLRTASNAEFLRIARRILSESGLLADAVRYALEQAHRRYLSGELPEARHYWFIAAALDGPGPGMRERLIGLAGDAMLLERFPGELLRDCAFLVRGPEPGARGLEKEILFLAPALERVYSSHPQNAGLAGWLESRIARLVSDLPLGADWDSLYGPLAGLAERAMRQGSRLGLVPYLEAANDALLRETGFSTEVAGDVSGLVVRHRDRPSACVALLEQFKTMALGGGEGHAHARRVLGVYVGVLEAFYAMPEAERSDEIVASAIGCGLEAMESMRSAVGAFLALPETRRFNALALEMTRPAPADFAHDRNLWN